MQEEYFYEEDIRLVDILESFGNYFRYLFKKWYIFLPGVIGLTLCGYFFATLSAPKFTANASFNAIDSRISSMGGLMSMMGISFSGGTSNDVLTGIFSSRNIFYNSLLHDMITNEGTREKIGNVYMHTLKYDEGFAEDPNLKGFKFKANEISEMTKLELQIASMMYADFVDGSLDAEYDIATGLIKAEVESPEYELSKNLASNMLKATIDFYQQKQVENAKASYKNTDRRLDSINNEILIRQRRIAQNQDINIFNKKQISEIEVQKLTQELAVLNVMYNDATNSKESAKAGLTPTNMVRIVDDPIFSVDEIHKGKILWSAIGFAASLILVVIPLLLHKAVIDGREENKVRETRIAKMQTE